MIVTQSCGWIKSGFLYGKSLQRWWLKLEDLNLSLDVDYLENKKVSIFLFEYCSTKRRKSCEKGELTYGCLRDEQLIIFEPGDYLHKLLHKAWHAADKDRIIAFHDKFVMYLQLVGLLGNCGERRRGG